MSRAYRAPAHIRQIQPYRGGTALEREPGERCIVRLNANENTAGAAPGVQAALARAAAGVSFYPDGEGLRLRTRIAQHHGVTPEQVLLGCGSGEVIDIVFRAFVSPGETVVMSGLPFVQYRLSSQLTNARMVLVPTLAGSRRDDVVGFTEAARGARLVCLANPNNPTGTYLTRAELSAYFAAVPEDVLTIVDEAYFDYVTAPDYPLALEDLAAGRNVVVLRTFSKAHGLAGLRVGYAIGHPELIDDMNRARPPFNVTGPAQEAAVAALDAPEWVAAARERNRVEKARLEAELRARGVAVTPSVGNFFLADFALPGAEVAARLEEQGVLVRYLPYPGLERTVRITVGQRHENDLLLAAVESRLLVG
jgi:histidinol-phosphate aminotransferase